MKYVQFNQRSLKEKNAQKSNHDSSAGFQPQTQSTSVNSNLNINNTGTTEGMFATEVTGYSISISFARIAVFTKPLKVPSKINRGNSDFSY